MSANLQDYDFEFPEELTAQEPLSERSSSKMMVLKTDGSLEHRQFCHLSQFLKPNDLIVVNNTSVLACRVYAQKPTGGKVEVFLLRPTEENELEWSVLLSPARGLIAGMRLKVYSRTLKTLSSIEIELTNLVTQKFRVRFDSVFEMKQVLIEYGEMPLPPYIKRPNPRTEDRERYQTTFAKNPGAVAAPTAGLHFTPDIRKSLIEKGIHWTEITLHVGLGTFAPIKTDHINEHVMHSEWYEISPASLQALVDCKKRKGRVLAVGSTALRTLETYALTEKSQGWTDLFIKPGFDFRIVDLMLTNFHRPKSTLMILVSAFVGRERILQAYREAIQREYRLFSYGDCMLLEKIELSQKAS